MVDYYQAKNNLDLIIRLSYSVISTFMVPRGWTIIFILDTTWCFNVSPVRTKTFQNFTGHEVYWSDSCSPEDNPFHLNNLLVFSLAASFGQNASRQCGPWEGNIGHVAMQCTEHVHAFLRMSPFGFNDFLFPCIATILPKFPTLWFIADSCTTSDRFSKN